MKISIFTLEEDHRADLEFLLTELSGKKRTANLASHEHVHNVGAFDGSTLIGFVQLLILPKTTFVMAHIEDLIVHPEYRHKGIGRQLLERVVSLAKDKGVAVLNLTTRHEREAAVALFTKLGFTNPGNMPMRLTLDSETE